ncbi:hypothetical protein AJ80_04940 [Polytolypa hystricis UAMH7299]|uniref:C2H2-type domain-containing protein n=1 Tax=Polytolypa hystricis (strain UAMH7299) TaxID=1447883 RepID=A0A2B7Y8X8_POLH7|nr:hypothetical protein AJ80_04940 [Polytolypa hystricis UAMH7299]
MESPIQPPITTVTRSERFSAEIHSASMQLNRSRTCSICHRIFKRKEHCLRHERAHTKTKPYKCSFCDRRYGRKDLVVRHEKTLHTEALKKSMSARVGLDTVAARQKRPQSRTDRSTEAGSRSTQPKVEKREHRNNDGTRHPNVPGPQHSTFPPPPIETKYDHGIPTMYAGDSYTPYPLTPLSFESSEFRVSEAHIFTTSFSNESQLPPCPAQVDGVHYRHQLISPATAEAPEARVIPIDPRLLT